MQTMKTLHLQTELALLAGHEELWRGIPELHSHEMSLFPVFLRLGNLLFLLLILKMMATDLSG
jgi:hypothetical protein